MDITRFINPLLGKFEFRLHGNVSDLIDQASPIDGDVRRMSTIPLATGLYVSAENGKNYLKLRTRIGQVFPSLHYLELGQPSVLTPHISRLAFGYFAIFFLVMAVVVSVALAIENIWVGATACAVAFITYCTLLIFAFVEKTFLITGYKAYI